MSQALAVFLPLIAPEVPGCPVVLMKEQILNAAIDFCERSNIWLETQTPYAVTAALADYNFTTITDAAVHSIRSATFNGAIIDALTREWCDIYTPGWRPGVSPVLTGPPVGVTQTTTTAFRIVPTPVANGTLILEVSYRPTRTALVLPDLLFHEYKEAMTTGALARLLAMSDVPWKDLNQAAIHAGRFKEYFEGANLRQTKGFGRASLRVAGQFM